jgi:hypothetical protein
MAGTGSRKRGLLQPLREKAVHVPVIPRIALKAIEFRSRSKAQQREANPAKSKQATAECCD